jgi:hypothetical protein
LALVAQGSGNFPQARQHLRDVLRLAVPVQDYQSFTCQMVVVPAMALLLADEGQLVRAVGLQRSRQMIATKNQITRMHCEASPYPAAPQ